MNYLIVFLVAAGVLTAPGYLALRFARVRLELPYLLFFSVAISLTVPLFFAYVLNHFLGVRPFYAYILGIVLLPVLSFIKARVRVRF